MKYFYFFGNFFYICGYKPIVMRILYYIYQVCFALPILLVLTILTALTTTVGSLIGDRKSVV